MTNPCLFFLIFIILGSLWISSLNRPHTQESFSGCANPPDLPPSDHPWVRLGKSLPTIPPRGPQCVQPIEQCQKGPRPPQGKDFVDHMPCGITDYPPHPYR